jgi:hypothetical protein
MSLPRQKTAVRFQAPLPAGAKDLYLSNFSQANESAASEHASAYVRAAENPEDCLGIPTLRCLIRRIWRVRIGASTPPSNRFILTSVGTLEKIRTRSQRRPTRLRKFRRVRNYLSLSMARSRLHRAVVSARGSLLLWHSSGPLR